MANNDPQLTRVILLWLCFSFRAMKFDELCEVAAMGQDGDAINEENRLFYPDDLLSACGSLVTYSVEKDTFTLAHSSVRDYLTDKVKSGPAAMFHLNEAVADQFITKSCLNYLLQPELRTGYCTNTKDLAQRLDNLPLLSYIADYFIAHLERVDPHGPLSSLIQEFLNTQYAPRNGSFGSFVQRFLPRLPLSKILGTTGLYIAAREGLVSLVRLIIKLEGTKNLETPGGKYESTPLHVAAWAGHTEVVRELLAAGANANEKNCSGDTGLFWAEVKKYKEIARLLKDAGAKLDGRIAGAELDDRIAKRVSKIVS
jgi:ankyrin repeat protein